MAAIDRSIRENLLAQLELPVASVECPQESRIAKAGDTFLCTVTPLVGGRLTVTVTQRDDQGNVTWEVTKTEGLLDLRKLATSVSEGLKAQIGLEAAVDCAGRWRASTPGDTFDCQATTGDGQSIVIGVTISDTEGNVSWRTR